MKVLNAMQIKAGAKSEYNKMGAITQPVQFIARSEKDDEWTAWNLDWLEWQGLKQIRRNSRRLMKNYKLAKGIIDKTDYIVEDNNDYKDLVEILTKQDISALELKFYPIIPNVINVLVNEFSKRSSKISFRTVDDYSYNELLEQKREMLEQNLFSDAAMKLMSKMIESGMDPNSPEAQQQLAPENLKTLPEIEEFFKKDYRNVVEEWAEHQREVDEERFRMQELEERGFMDMLITDREFWHFRMLEDDYELELWNPVLTFYHKSPDVRYVSQSSWVGKIDMMSVADVIDKFGWLMTEEQLKSLEAIYPVRSAGYPVQGYQNDGSYYDATKSHDWNVNPPGLAYRQFVSTYDNFIYAGGDIVNWILGESEDYFDMGMAHLLRVATIYWKSQRRVGYLTKIDDLSNVHIEIVDETYKVTDKPVYDTTLFKNKTKDNLAFGEHIDWIWINEVWGGTKIGPNHPSFWGMNNPGGVNPMYLGATTNKPGPIKFQFKGDLTPYGCKLPVEGSIFTDRNTRSTSLVDLMKPFQIGYNIVNNQISDILVDELGTVIAFDQNWIPRHSMNEDWGKHNLAKTYVAMKNFQMLPFDTTIANTESATNFQHFTKLDLSQTERLLSRIKLAEYFKQQAFEVIGVAGPRMAQPISQETATGVETSLNASYAQTEHYFTRHSDYLMPRVHEMRTDLAQFYNSTKPSLRLQYITSADEKVNFQINGTELLSRDLNVFCTTKANQRAILERLKTLSENNNTSGATIYDLGRIMQTESQAELNTVLKGIDEKMQNAKEQERQHEIQLQQNQQAFEDKQAEIKRLWESGENDKNNRARVLEAEIRAAGYGAMKDINANNQSDFIDELERIEGSNEFQQTMNLQNQKEQNRNSREGEKIDLEREKLATEREKAAKNLEIAKENKNRFDAKKVQKGKKK